MPIDRTATLRRAERLVRQGRLDEAIAEYLRAVENTPDNPAEVDEVRAIAEYPDPAAGRDEEEEEEDPELMLAAAALQIRADCPDQGLALVNRLLERHPGRHEDVAELGWTIADAGAEVGFAIVDLAARTAAGLGDLPSAAAALQEFVTRVPTHIPALVRLVEICVEGGLEAATYNAQAQLADAYIAAGLGDRAHAIAEELAACEPWEPLHLERLRRAIELAGAPGRDGRSPSGAGRFDLARIAGETIDAPGGPVHDDAGGGEIDLGLVLDREEDGPPIEALLTSRDEDPERVSACRRSAAGDAAPDMAGEMYRLGLALREAGDIGGAIEALEAAAPAARWRFACASLLGRLCRERGMTRQAIAWYERAAASPGASAADAHELRYELAEALEEHGEIGRALAVCLELKAEAGAYRDVARRIAWLTKVQARG